MKKTSAILLKYTPVVVEDGTVEKELSFVGNVSGVFLPLNSELAAKPSGFDENSAFDFFYKGSNEQMLTGNVIRYLGRDYHIVNIADYGKIKIVRISSVVGTNSVKTVVRSLRV